MRASNAGAGNGSVAEHLHTARASEPALSLSGVQSVMMTHVLVVDDNAADRNLVRLSLSESPYIYKVECAERLSEGLHKLETEQPDVILLDLNLPDSQGGDTVRRVVDEVPQVPILVLTGSDDDGLALDAMRAGAQDYIVKGQIDSSALTRAMRYAIERHRLQIALQDAREEQLEFKDTFLSHVSHELRSPLACIHQYTEVMLEGLAGPLTNKGRGYLHNVLRSTKQLNGLINDLLDAARVNVGKLTIELGRIQPADVVAQLLQLFEAKAKAKNVTLTAKVAPYLPAVLADHSRLLQIFTNLLENALKFTEPGGVITISAATFPEDPKFVQWSVADTGQGIHPENLSRIFERLYQEQSAVHNRQGLGLGLAICKELVERHAGRIWVDSKPGKGSVFSFTTPVFSLLEITSPLLVREGKVRPATVVAVEIASPTKTVPADTWEYSRRRCREVIERCMLPDKDVVLPSMHASDREVVFVLACTDLKGAAVLEARISSQLGSIPELAKACNIRTFCVSLPEVPPDRTQLMEQLEWISRKIEELALRAVGA